MWGCKFTRFLKLFAKKTPILMKFEQYIAYANTRIINAVTDSYDCYKRSVSRKFLRPYKVRDVDRYTTISYVNSSFL